MSFCTKFPHCVFGDTCNKLHTIYTKCNKGKDCQYEFCHFIDHPHKNDIINVVPICKNGKSCKYTNCKYYGQNLNRHVMLVLYRVLLNVVCHELIFYCLILLSYIYLIK